MSMSDRKQGEAGGAGAPTSPAGATGANATWDAGDVGCGELVIELRLRLLALDPGQLLRLVARDPGAAEDLPAWCRMTGHVLRHAAPPEFLIERRK